MLTPTLLIDPRYAHQTARLICWAILVALPVSMVLYGGPVKLLFLSDFLGDYVKFVLAFSPHFPSAGSPDLKWYYELHLENSRIQYKPFPPFFLPPLSMSLTFAAVGLFSWVDPVKSYAFLAIGFLVGVIWITAREVPRRSWVFVALSTVASYPLVFLLARGNLYAAITGLCLIAALLRPSADWRSALLIAIAINIRPNAVVCLLPFLLFDWRWRFIIRVAVASALVFAAGTLLASGLDNRYSLSVWANSLVAYSQHYGAEGAGVHFGSSLYGALHLTIGGGTHSQVFATLFSMTAGATLLWMIWLRRLTYSEAVFGSLCLYAFGTSVFADYHLIAFFVPLVVLLRDRTSLPVVCQAVTVLVLVAKHYPYQGVHSVQTLINPALLIVGFAAIVVQAGRRKPGLLQSWSKALPTRNTASANT
jgi:hypothetical protein